jgi:hypothetical protein
VDHQSWPEVGEKFVSSFDATYALSMTEIS